MQNWINLLLILLLGVLLTSFIGRVGRSQNFGKMTPGWARFIKIFWVVYLAAAYILVNLYLIR